LIGPLPLSNEMAKYVFFISLSLFKNPDAEEVLAIAIEAPGNEVVFKKSRCLKEPGIFIL